MRRTFLALLVAALASAANAAQPTTTGKSTGKRTLPAKADTRKTVGLLSEIGSTFTAQKIGIMVFGNEKASVSIDSWGIDALVNAKVTSSIKARFNVIPLKLSKEGMAALASAPGSLFGDRDGYICNVLHKAALGQGFDYYLRVSVKESPFANTNQFVKGLGIVHREGFGSGYTFVHALFGIEVLDGRTCSIVRREEPPSTQGFLFAAIHGPSLEVDASWMPAVSNAAQDARLKEATRTLVDR